MVYPTRTCSLEAVVERRSDGADDAREANRAPREGRGISLRLRRVEIGRPLASRLQIEQKARDQDCCHPVERLVQSEMCQVG